VHKDCDTPISIFNIHTDYNGALTTRVLECATLMRAAAASPWKFVMTGDFNAKPDTEEIHLITDALSDRGVVDCTEKLGDTYHGFGLPDKSKWMKIDYIFTDGECENSYAVEDIPQNGVYYSDHNAVCAEIILK
jgi:endonuclease/exonuclease/phosphatase family metal-dependent hydrolase